MMRIAGVVMLLILLYAALFASDPNAGNWSNLKDVSSRHGFYGILTVGVGVLIVTGGIDLSIGSVLGFSVIFFGVLLRNQVHPLLSLAIILFTGTCIGFMHGMLVTQLKLQPFLVTLCSLFLFRGLARMLSDRPVGLSQTKTEAPDSAAMLDSLRYWFIGKDENGVLGFPHQLIVLGVVVVLVGLVLHASVVGRYWYAIGYNETAARYAGIPTTRQRILAYMLCSLLASLGGVLFLLDYGSAMPENVGEYLELYAITGAVLGGCSLRGGEGTIVGMALGAAVLPVLRNLVIFMGIRDAVVPAIIGVTLLLGAIGDEFFRHRANRRT